MSAVAAVMTDCHKLVQDPWCLTITLLIFLNQSANFSHENYNRYYYQEYKIDMTLRFGLPKCFLVTQQFGDNSPLVDISILWGTLSLTVTQIQTLIKRRRIKFQESIKNLSLQVCPPYVHLFTGRNYVNRGSHTRTPLSPWNPPKRTKPPSGWSSLPAEVRHCCCCCLPNKLRDVPEKTLIYASGYLWILMGGERGTDGFCYRESNILGGDKSVLIFTWLALAGLIRRPF